MLDHRHLLKELLISIPVASSQHRRNVVGGEKIIKLSNRKNSHYNGDVGGVRVRSHRWRVSFASSKEDFLFIKDLDGHN